MSTDTVNEVTPDDEGLLASMGYKQEFKREYKPLDLFWFAFNLIGIVPAVSSWMYYAAQNGGPVGMVWGWVACSFFIICVTLSIAELSSSMPMMGGPYHWAYRLSSPGTRNFTSWITGFLDCITWISAASSADASCAQLILIGAAIGSDLKYIPTLPHTFGVYIAILISHCLLLGTKTKVVASLQKYGFVLNIALVLAIIIGIPSATPKEFKNDSSFVFGDFTNALNLWPNGFSFMLSFLSPTYMLISGFDSTTHISEESHRVKTSVPWAAVGALVISCVFGWLINVVMAFYMGSNLALVVANPLGPMPAILLNSFGKRGTLAIWSFIVVAQYMMGINTLTVASRQAWAFARDGAFPLSRYFYEFNPRTRTPTYTVWIAGVWAAGIGTLPFLRLGPITFGIVGQCVSSSIPIVARFVGGQPFVPGSFYLGRFGLPVAVLGVAWLWYTTVILFFPSGPNPTARQGNWSPLFISSILVPATVYYYLPKSDKYPWYKGGGIHWYNGPVNTLEQKANSLDFDSRDIGLGEREKSIDAVSLKREEGVAIVTLEQNGYSAETVTVEIEGDSAGAESAEENKK